MNYVSIFLVSFIIALSGALAPGPLLATVIHESTKHGPRAGPLIIFGHILLEAAMLICIVFGFIRFIRSPALIMFISLTGSGILIYLGIDILKATFKPAIVFKPQNKKSANLVLMGITMSIANPYWTIWWLTIGLGLTLGAKKTGVYAIIIFFLGHMLADFIWYALISMLVSRNKQIISGMTYKIITSLCAFALIGFGIYFAITSLIATTSL